MIRIGGMTPLTSIDFPGHLAAVLYLQGCPWRCGYCHNPDLIPARPIPARGDAGIGWDQALAFLQRRRGLLDGVVFSGGEPTSQAALPEAIAQVAGMGYRIGLHTGGMYPARLRRALPALAWVGLDIKAPPSHYDAITARRGSARPVLESLDAVLASGVDYECRTTWRPELFAEEDLHRLGAELRARGVRHWAVQECRVRGRGIPAEQRPDLVRLRRGFARFVYREG